MKSMKRGLAVLLAALLMVPTLSGRAEGTDEPVPAEAEAGGAQIVNLDNLTVDLADKAPGEEPADAPEETGGAEDSESANPDSETEVSTEDAAEASESGDESVIFSTGYDYKLVVDKSAADKEKYAGYTGIFEEDGSYVIEIPEEDPFFPYEVQFVRQGAEEGENLWFMTPDSVVEFGGHTFRVKANFTGKAVTQMSLDIAGDKVVLYPEKKEFGGAAPMSLLPLEEKSLQGIDLRGYTPLELTMVSLDSIFKGENALKDTDSVVWTVNYWGTDYTITQKGSSVNLSYADSFQMIVGEPDQLAAENTRYLVSINKTGSSGWLVPTFYGQDTDGNRKKVAVKSENYSPNKEYGSENITLSTAEGTYQNGYLALAIDQSKYDKTKYTTLKAYRGQYASALEAAEKGEDITDQIFCKDMTQADAGFAMRSYGYSYITIVSFDDNENVTGCLPVRLYYSNTSTYLSLDYWMQDSAGYSVFQDRKHEYKDNSNHYTYTLYPGKPADGTYCQRFYYYFDGEKDNTPVTAAYKGLYSTIAEADAESAENVKEALFGQKGYAGDYSEGISFTIFVGEDGSENQQIYRYTIKTVEGEKINYNYEYALNSGTAVTFSGLRKDDGNENATYVYANVPSFLLKDDYAQGNFVVYLVDENVDRSKLALVFSIYEGLKLYAEGSTEPEVSGKSYHDFSKGPVQFTASSEDKKHSKNYWVQIVSKAEVPGKIFMNSLIDKDAETVEKDGAVHTTREVMLDTLHNNKHDIMLANMGGTPIESLSAELASDVVELDDYWTLQGKHELSGFTTTKRTTAYGQLSNLAMLRLRKKEGVANGTDVSGTLTLKSGETVLMVIKLTGTVGNPVITTKEIPAAVKYVPYGTMIQNSNKYDWNIVTYKLAGGKLPAGMRIEENGELYGVPTESGEFTFWVNMSNSYSSFGTDQKKFTLIVNENTDENVENATDPEYKLTDRVSYDYNESMGNQRMVSQGVFEEFTSIWLDGVELVKGVDYEAESGSTRITIYAQTLSKNQAKGKHTLGVEFRTASSHTLKPVAQNYVLGDPSSPENNDSGSSGSEPAPTATPAPAPQKAEKVESAVEIQNTLKDKVVQETGELAAVTVNAPMVLTTDVLQAMQDNGKNLSIAVTNGNNEKVYQWAFESAKLDGSKFTNIDLTVTFGTEKQKEIEAITGQTDAFYMSFSHHGDLPAPAVMTVYVGNKYKNGDVLYLYYYDEAANKVRPVSRAGRTVADGYVTYAITHCSVYFLTKQQPPADQATEEEAQAVAQALAQTSATPPQTDAAKTKSPETGDDSFAGGWAMLAICALGTAALLLRKKRTWDRM